MSNYLAIATVTETLRQMLNAVVQQAMPGARATAVRPSSGTSGGLPGVGVNVFLYQVGQNAAWRNADLPTRREDGALHQRPQVALDLHYLLTFYGEDQQLEPQRMMGRVTCALHSQPLLTRDQIAKAASAVSFLANSDLSDQVELVRFIPIPLTLEELSKLWSVFFQTPYVLSTAYQASVVHIEADATPQKALPVRARQILVMPFRRPVIESVSPQVILPSGILTIRGQNLQGLGTKVSFGTALAEPDTLSNQQITVKLPADLPAGVRTVQVTHQVDFGVLSGMHRGFESNIVAFTLAPQITTPEPISAARGSVLALSFAPPIGRTQQVALLVGDAMIAVPARPSKSPPAESIEFPIPTDFLTGTFLLRVRVDGAESPLVVDQDQDSQTFNQYIGPKVTISS